MRLAVIGAGAWGSALSVALSSIATQVLLYCRTKEQAEQINITRKNYGYLTDGVEFAANVLAISEFADLTACDLVVIATPINAMRAVLKQLGAIYQQLPHIIWLCKGFEAQSGMLPHEIVRQEFTEHAVKCAALLGPSFAHDVALSRITAFSLVSDNLDFAIKWGDILNGISNFRVYASTDVIGAEICAATKNIIAIAAGIVDGLALGNNARAALISRSLAEITRLVAALGGNHKTVYGLSGVGDLILTCTGNLSRNRNVGLKLAHGQSLAQIIAELGHVAEGVLTTKEVYTISQRLGVDMPIVNAVYAVLYQQRDIKTTIEGLLMRETKLEY